MKNLNSMVNPPQGMEISQKKKNIAKTTKIKYKVTNFG